MRHLFLSTPISTFSNNEEYTHLQGWIRDVQGAIEKQAPDIEVYCAASSVRSLSLLSDPKDSILRDIAALDDCDYFVLCYPRQMVTSAIIELGYALAKGKIIAILAKDLTDLPFLARKLDEVYPRVATFVLPDLMNDGTRAILNWLSENEVGPSIPP